MMEKVSLQEIAAVLVEKHNLRKKEAETFVTTMFDLVKEGLAADRLVKIKGLGTFKIVDIEARESVNVNTGERVVIDGHDKITFTPDNTMKELVNKPFSLFETVVLNEGVTFDDMQESTAKDSLSEPLDVPEPKLVATPEPDVASEPEPVVASEPEPIATPEPGPVAAQEPVVAPDPEPVAVSEPVVISNSEPADKQEIAETIVPLFAPESETELEDPEQESEKELEAEPEEKPETEEEIEEEFMSKKMTYISLVVAIVACVLSFFAGYYYRGEVAQPVESAVSVVVPVQAAVPADSVAADSLKADTTELSFETRPEVQTEAKAEVTPEPRPEVVPEAQSENKPEASAEESSKKYEKMDVRVRYGAYRIVGTDYQVTVRAGDTTAKIARRTLGPDMECYIEVYNGLTKATPLKEGQSLNIPRLQMKKKLKTNKNT